MGKKLNAIAQGLKITAAVMKSRKYSVADRPVRCPHCGGETFDQGDALLNTRVLTLLQLDWTNKSAWTLICVECGRIEWFIKLPDKRID